MDVEALLQEMTLEEKCAQLGATWFTGMLVDGALDDEAVERALPHSVGHIARIAATGVDSHAAAEAANRLQRFLAERTRLGIPALVHEEALEGLMGPGATQFPQAIGMAASWDPDLAEEVAAVCGRQARAIGVHVALAPVLDIARDPRWGRVEETFGEDPELASRMGVAVVRGLHGAGVHACGKHFIGHGAPLGGLNHAEVVTGPRRLRDVDAAPWRAAIHEAGLATVMNAYHEVDGLPCAGSPEILTDLLRGELGFDGCVVADYFAISDLDGTHHVAADKDEAARLALEAGLDIELPIADYYLTLPDQVRQGLIEEALVDRSCRRVLEQKATLGLFDDPYVDAEAVHPDLSTDDDLALARRAAARSLVLLSNDGTLPLAPGSRVAVLGPSADDARLLFGDYSWESRTDYYGDDSFAAPAVASGESRPNPTPRQAVAERFDVVEEIHEADVALVFVGGRSGARFEDTSGEFLDATELRLPAEQLALIEEVAASGTPTVVVVIGGRVHTLTEVVDHASALVMAWLPGEQGAHAILDVLAGDIDAAGRLPISILRAVGQVGVHAAHHHGSGKSAIYNDYIDSPATPLFRFGHGLSYTTWSYDDVRVTAGTTSEDILLDVEVTNTGDRDGEEVVQVYANDEVASVGRPARRLVAFHRLSASPGQTRRLRFTLPAGRLGFHGRDLQFRVEPGEVTFHVGRTSRTVTLTGDVEHPDPNLVAPFAVQVS
ncbi:MAG TPA: glycoside hydrolase family 3 N-terminal domain-containing protein [Acidimicrobiales bacterium]